MGSPRLPYRNHQGRTPPQKKIHPPDPRRGRAWQQPGPRGTGPGLRNAPRGRGSAVSRSPSALRWLHGSQRRGVRREETPGSQGQPTASPPPLLKTPPARLWSWIWAPVPRVQVAGGVSRASGGEGRWAAGAARVPARFWGGGQRLKSRQGEGSPPPCRCCQPSSGRGRSILCSRAPPSAAIPAHHAGSKREEPKGC